MSLSKYIRTVTLIKEKFKKTPSNLVIYSMTYLIIISLYGLFQRFSICIDMGGYVCNIDGSKINSLLTLTSYILAPLVALYIYNGWQVQSNYALKQKVVIKVNEHLRKISTILARNHSLYNRIIADKENNIDYEFKIDLEENQKLRVYNNELLSLLKELYYLSNKNKTYILYREKYGKHVQELSVYLKDIYQIKYEKKEEWQDRNKEISEYLNKNYDFSYFNDLDKYDNGINFIDCFFSRKDLFIEAYKIQNDITNYILKNDFILR